MDAFRLSDWWKDCCLGFSATTDQAEDQSVQATKSIKLAPFAEDSQTCSFQLLSPSAIAAKEIDSKNKRKRAR
jgi:hypothetical protein